MEPRISVVIPAYNAARYVAEAVDSVLAQSLPPREVIVVDDGSTDDTEAVVRRFQDRVRYVRQPNGGSAAARNRGIREARGELIALLDADDVWFPEKLKKQWECLRDHPEAGLVHTNFYYCDENGDERVLGVLGRERVGRCYEIMFQDNGINNSTTLIRRECFDRVGLFDESFKTCQDYDLYLRMSRYYEFAFLDEPLAVYRRHDSNITNDNSRMLKNELRVRRKALQDDPELLELVGKRRVSALIHDRAFFLGYLLHDADRREEARKWLRVALAHRPWHVYSLYLYLANFLPSPWVRGLRRLKAKLSQRPAANADDRTLDRHGVLQGTTQESATQ